MVFGWLYRRAAKHVIKELSKAPDSKTRVKAAPDSPGQAEESYREPIYPLEGSEDPVESVYVQAMSAAMEDGDYKTAADIATKLKRFRQASKAGSAGGRGRGKEAEEETASSLISNSIQLDVGNLAPHADQIASELVGWLSASGVVPDGLKDQAVGLVAGQIKTHPDLITKGLDILDNVLKKYAGAKQGAQQQGPQLKFDPAHPELWAQGMGYGK